MLISRQYTWYSTGINRNMWTFRFFSLKAEYSRGIHVQSKICTSWWTVFSFNSCVNLCVTLTISSCNYFCVWGTIPGHVVNTELTVFSVFRWRTETPEAWRAVCKCWILSACSSIVGFRFASSVDRLLMRSSNCQHQEHWLWFHTASPNVTSDC